ncbi:acetyl-CoA synthetase-like protein [Exidia glandulosa HHB12029]|uniref:Acetyl-CoA synthetase-like protein n=1 Tax=Exidia glandulosa HHB12029 TaxID=1314781 RepID=A0A165DCX0_EXIGL|nr:acetyl-CoA synthetase-like protein [Exidia glandulosa HHB12029]
MKLYQSTYPAVELPRCSIFSLVFPRLDRHREDSPLYIDAPSGYVVRRGDFRRLALSFAYGVTHFDPPATASHGLLGSLTAKKRGLPLRQGQVAMLFMPNSIAYPLVFYGLQAAGIRTTLANASYTPRELAHQLKDSAAEVVFVHPTMLPSLEQAWVQLGVDPDQARRRTVLVSWEPWNAASAPLSTWTTISTLLSLGSLQQEVTFEGNKVHETAMLCYSSGTTGLAKGVETSHFNVTSLVAIQKPMVTWDSSEVVLGVLPFYHIFAAVQLTIFYAVFNIPVVIQPVFTPDLFCANIARYRVTTSLVVPPILLALAKHPAPEAHDMTSFHRAICGAAPLSESLMTAVITRLESLGCKDVVISQGYGLTETSPTVFLVPDHLSRTIVGSCGLLAPNCQVRVVLDGPGEKDAPDGEPGELWIRGPNVMKGYLNNSKATRDVLTKDGFFKTGDIVVRHPQGHYYVVDRKKELIKYKGFQVAPADLEAVLISHPEIIDAAVIGVYSAEQETELPRAYVVHAKGLGHFKSSEERAKFEASIATWVTQKVAKHKQIRGGVVLIDSVPKSAAGKILRRELRDRVKDETGRDPITGAPVKTKAKL